jgi:hypothetical protein
VVSGRAKHLPSRAEMAISAPTRGLGVKPFDDVGDRNRRLR